MARMYSRKKGKSGSKRPVSKRIPQWCTYTPEEVEDLIIKLAKKDITPSKIGVIIRDQYGIPLVKPILGKKITEVLSSTEHKLSVPEDLTSLLKKAEKHYSLFTKEFWSGALRRA